MTITRVSTAPEASELGAIVIGVRTWVLRAPPSAPPSARCRAGEALVLVPVGAARLLVSVQMEVTRVSPLFSTLLFITYASFSFTCARVCARACVCTCVNMYAHE